MTDPSHLEPVPDEPTNPLEGFDLPVDWSDGARETFAEVLRQRPDLAGADLAALEHACALTSTADALDAISREAGFTSTGSAGQLVAHPAAVESRLSRTAAAAILNRLALAPTGPRVTNTQRARAAARARWKAPQP